VPLAGRRVYGYVVRPPYAFEPPATTRTPLRLLAVLARLDVPAAFDATGLALARWTAERCVCSLAEALGCVVHTAALPRIRERLVPGERPEPGRLPAVPDRLLRLIFEEIAEPFAPEALLRHPEARRAGDRGTLQRALGALVRAGALARERSFVRPPVREAREGVLAPGAAGVALGARARALVARVAAEGEWRRADARLAGYSPAVIGRALAAGALVERDVRVGLRRTRAAASADDAVLVPTAAQFAAIEALDARARAGGFAEALLQGVTGSGKTLVYVETIRRELARGGRAIVLVPEIALTPQTARRFERAFGERVAVLHSGLSERERFEARGAAARGEIDVVVGARSAVFATLPACRLVVVDEAHERSYKQESAPRYHAVDVARERMRLAGGLLVLGSATPPLEAYAQARAGRIDHLRLDARATAAALPPVRVVDMTRELRDGNRRIFSSPLVTGLEARLARGEQSILFVNRRGSATFVLCRSCGEVPGCPRCDVSLVAHRAEGLLRCHLCDLQEPLPSICPVCRSGAIREFGIGTQRVAETVRELFPRARIVRMDADTTTRIGDHARLLDAFAAEGDVLVGTQMVAKGLDFPRVTLVGVVAADVGLHLPDFRAAERIFDLLVQVAGRSGRASAGEAIVQTYAPDHPAIRFAARHEYDGFATSELAEREALRYPPYGELAYLGAIGRDRARVVAVATRLAEALRARAFETLGPAPYPVARVDDEWRYRIAVKAADLAPLRRLLREEAFPRMRAEPGVRLVADFSP